MAWVEQAGDRWRLRDQIGGKQVTIVKNLGQFKAYATEWLTNYRKARAQGFVFSPPIEKELIQQFLEARASGETSMVGYKRIPIEQLCDLFLEHHGPSLKGGKSNHWRSPYRTLGYQLNVIKRRWSGKMSDEPTPHDVRDLIALDETPGTRMKHLNTVAKMFKSFAEWNAIEGEIPFKIRIPAVNPAATWRSKLKPHEKEGGVRTRVLEPDEWAKFRPHLTQRSGAICEMALRRFLSLADIKKISRLSIRDEVIEGLREKSGVQFRVPVLSEQPTAYDFTNFRREFHNAQVSAGMDYPKDHPLHFSPRDLRRTGATWAYRETGKIKEISIMLGHKRISTTERYLGIRTVDLTHVAQAVDRLASTDVLKTFGVPLGLDARNDPSKYT